MKAIIKIASAGKLTQDQQAIMKRVASVLIEHNLSVKIIIKQRAVKRTKFMIKVS